MSSTGSTRGNPSMGDILRSMFVIAVVLLALWGIGQFFTSEPETPVKTVDYARVVEQARPAADFPLAAPPSLPEGWKATSARFQPDAWHLGVLTDNEEYIGLEQVTTSVSSAIERFAKDSQPQGEAEVAGQTWERRKGPDDRLTYVRREGELTTLVDGTASRSVIEDYIASLSTS